MWGAIFVALLVYVTGVMGFFVVGKSHSTTQLKKPTTIASIKDSIVQTVLGASIQEEPTTNPIPESYKITVIPRRQMFGLSCEFASATTILYHYTAKPEFSVDNAKSAEELLIQKVGVSQNPNLGIRMGSSVPQTTEELYANLNQKFGGSDYYGVHAPPFIDIFAKYGLKAKAITRDQDVIDSLEKALYSGHLVMTWIKVGYGQPVDASFTYGNVPIIKGEHSVVIYGYDKTGVFIMDPGNGTLRHLSYEDLLNATAPFSMPFLEVYTSLEKPTVEDTIILDKTTGLLRENLNILVENATKKVGVGDQTAGILRDFGYKVTDIKNADKKDYVGVTISIKNSLKDYMYLLKKDLTVAQYDISSMSADLSASSAADAVVVVGE